MIPAVRDVLLAHRFLRRRFGWEVYPPEDEIVDALERARSDAQRLADASGDDLAAFFFACAVVSPSLGEDFMMSVILVTRNQARALGREPVANARDLGRDLLLKSREIAGGALTFPAFCTWLDLRLPAPTGGT